jgi:YHS domain-containing protein
VQSPEIYLNDLGISVKCVVVEDSEAILDIAHREFVNWETFYFSSEDARRRFQETPEQFAGRLTNPVTREPFELAAGSHRREHNGRTFYFPDEVSVAEFDNDPDKYATPMLSMRPTKPGE